MIEWRCTRNQPYLTSGCPGHADLSARQGYYCRAASEAEALAFMHRAFPRDWAGFTAQEWR